MPEQPVHHRKDSESDQQTILFTILKCKGDTYENDRQCCTGRIQCRN